MSIKLEGANSLITQLQNVVSDEKIEGALKKACALVERTAKQKAPKDNGDLRNSIESKVEGTEGVIFSTAYYAPYVEYGTGLFAENGNGRKEVPWVYVEGSTKSGNSKTVYDSPEDAEAAAAYLRSKGLDAVVTYGKHPHPFLRPALEEKRDKILKMMKEGITNND